jgi:hypothetical protein
MRKPRVVPHFSRAAARIQALVTARSSVLRTGERTTTEIGSCAGKSDLRERRRPLTRKATGEILAQAPGIRTRTPQSLGRKPPGHTFAVQFALAPGFLILLGSHDEPLLQENFAGE